MSRLVLVLAAAVLTAGCGVQPSGVIRGAAPPSGRVQPPGSSVSLFLVSNGELTPVQRTVDPGPVSLTSLLALLAKGPTADERAEGLGSEVPRTAAPFSVSTAPGHRLVVTPSPGPLSDLAVDQIVCTAGEPDQLVSVRGRPPRSCPPP